MNRVILFMLFSIFLQSTAFAKGNVKVLSKKESLAAQLKEANTKYVIKENLIIDRDIILPVNCILKIDGGSISGSYTLHGQNTQIVAGASRVFGNEIKLAGTWDITEVLPEWFGAVGDGKTDDTNAIRKAIWFAAGKILFFQSKTYIINVSSSNNKKKQRIIFSNTKCSEIIGNKAIIKLGNNDNCNLYKNKGFGTIFSVYTIDYFHVKGITIDFNYENNPIYQTRGIRQGIQENTQQNAFLLRLVRKVVIEDCNFIGHSGTNCIDYSDAEYNAGDKSFEVKIENCNFLRTGGKSFFRQGNNYTDAYHDSSTIAIHYRGRNHNTPLKVDIINNYFEGIGENAFNAVEADASDLNFCGNVIEKYAVCLYPCANIYNSRVDIRNNRFLGVSHGIVLWLRGGSDDGSNQYGYKSMNIIGNVCTIDMGYWVNKQRYDNYMPSASNRYGFILTTSWNDKSIQDLSIVNNVVKYLNINDIDPQICSKATIHFESVGKSVATMKCRKISVTQNFFYNAVNRILHNSLFQEIDTLIFNNNYVCDPFAKYKPDSINGGGLIFLNHHKAGLKFLDNPTINCFLANNNIVKYDGFNSFDKCAVFLNCRIKETNEKSKTALILKRNKCSSVPQYGPISFEMMESLFKIIDIDEIYQINY